MSIFSWNKPKNFFTEEEQQQIVAAIQQAERSTSGEVRVFVESKCRFVDPVDRAREVFLKLEMQRTEQRNATLVYLATKHRQAAVYGDAGIHEKVGEQFWLEVVAKMLQLFRQEKLAAGVCQGIISLGEALQKYFPYNKDTDKNELPDEIVFGR